MNTKTPKLQLDTIKNLCLRPFPVRPVAMRVAMTSDVITGVVERNGYIEVYTTAVKGRVVMGGNTQWSPVISSLIKLRVMTAGLAEEWKRIVTLTERTNSSAWKARAILRDAADLGLRLSPTQKARLKKLSDHQTTWDVFATGRAI